MTTPGVTTTGLREMERAIDQFPAEQEALGRSVAFRISRSLVARAKAIYASKIHDVSPDAVRFYVDEDADKRQFVVHAEAAPDKPENLPLWLERGTVHMKARPYMRPALDEHQEPYRKELEAATLEAARKLMG